MATPKMTAVSMESMPMSSMILSAWAMSSRSSMQQLAPKPQIGLVLEAGGHVLAFLVVVDLRTLDDAAGMAAVLRLAAAGDDGVVHGLAADLVVPFELAGTEVPGRQAAGLVEDVDQDVGAVGGQPFAADRVIEHRLGEGLGGGLEFLRIGDVRRRGRRHRRWRCT